MSTLKVNTLSSTGGTSYGFIKQVVQATKTDQFATSSTSYTDYLALSDATLSEDMRTYRQALRDLPANTSDPANPTWPTKP
jgi:hypothetical protein|tara:strand:+ start:377 stop:619 length:243 start_codon:yes stop_codon:yes gene_type:complete